MTGDDHRIAMSEDMLISAVRYALGRATYIVMCTCDEVRCCWPDLTQRARDVITRDVTEHLRLVDLRLAGGMDCDHDQWRRLAEWIGMAS